MKFFLPSFFVLPFWYPILSTRNISNLAPTKGFLFSEPYVIYKNRDQNYTIHTDICPHQGASLSEGKVTKSCNLQCPYHGFEFDNGNFCKIPNPNNPSLKSFASRIQLPVLNSKKMKDFLFVRFDDNVNQTIFYPPEEHDSNFKSVEGTVDINTNYLSVCENLLDMLHISYVHSFGSLETPLPHHLNFTWCSPYHGKSTFLYSPNEKTISNKVGKVNTVKVENEFILPTNTITRVFAGNTIKTVFTRTIPISDTKCILYWKIYRNFWIFPFGDWLIDFLMKKTIEEDLWILKRLYTKHRDGPLQTKYDKTIREFRNCYKKYMFNEKK
jgi:phenylpropionate dioxygenase-like ring-hydroxylating dioxygenase large terminal subunit